MLADRYPRTPPLSFQAPSATGKPPQGSPHNLAFLILVSRHLGAHGSFLGLLAGQLLGCNPQAHRPCTCPALLRPKKNPEDLNRDIRGSLERGSYASNAKGPGGTAHSWCTAKGRQDAATFLPTLVRRLPFIGGKWHQLGSSITRETSSWATFLTASRVNDLHGG